MRTLNLGILAHVDAGKTSLTERLLFAAGVLDELGSVDAGTTQTDSLALERRRGITIASAVASFSAAGVTVNLIDTPGHPDFIAEVERALGVLDGVVLVVSAVEGVQPQTRILMRALRRLRIPTLIFVNKIDRRGARPAEVLRAIDHRLTRHAVAMGSVDAAGTRGASFRPFPAEHAGLRSALLERLADHDDGLLAAYVDDADSVGAGRLRAALVAQTGRARVHPVYFGSAVTGAGVDALTGGIAELLPAVEASGAGEPAGTVFKIERGPAGERIAYLRLFSGTVRVRDRVRLRRSGDGDGPAGTVTAISVFDGGPAQPRPSMVAGQIGRVRGLGAVRIGDVLGEPPHAAGRQFAPPTLETVVVPRVPAQRAALHRALTRLAEQDPLIALRQDDVRREISVSLYGEVQKEVVEATLQDEFGVAVSFRDSTTICIERPVGVGAAVELIGTEPNPFLATVGLRVEPAPVGNGIGFRLEVELGSMPAAFFAAVRETVPAALTQGLHGWQVTDCTVTMTHCGYWPRQSHAHATFDKSMSSTAGDFRSLTPLVLMSALRRAGTRVHEPMHRFVLEIPAAALPAVLRVLAGLRAVPDPPALRGASGRLEGRIPAARVHELARRLPGLTGGEGVLESGFEAYQPVVGAVPSRSRTDHNPLNRKEYLLRTPRR